MKKDEVPQEGGVLGPWKEICYAVDEAGRYVLEPSAGWEPANEANRIAWAAIREEALAMKGEVAAGKKSPLAFHMVIAQMDAKLLARYAGVSRWRVLFHRRPFGFKRLDAALATRYAEILGIPLEALARVPESLHLPDGETP